VADDRRQPCCCVMCVIQRIGGWKSHPEFHRVRASLCTLRGYVARCNIGGKQDRASRRDAIRVQRGGRAPRGDAAPTPRGLSPDRGSRPMGERTPRHRAGLPGDAATVAAAQARGPTADAPEGYRTHRPYTGPGGRAGTRHQARDKAVQVVQRAILAQLRATTRGKLAYGQDAMAKAAADPVQQACEKFSLTMQRTRSALDQLPATTRAAIE
jgi:hypothetical protein